MEEFFTTMKRGLKTLVEEVKNLSRNLQKIKVNNLNYTISQWCLNPRACLDIVYNFRSKIHAALTEEGEVRLKWCIDLLVMDSIWCVCNCWILLVWTM